MSSKGNKEDEKKKAERKEHKKDSWVKKTPKEDLQGKYKNLYGEKPDDDLTKEKLGEAIQKKEKEQKDHHQDVRASGKEDAPDTTATLQPLTDAEPQDWLGSNRDPDVMLSVPNLGIDHIGLNVKNLRAHVELHAKVLDLVELHVGADVSIEEVDLQINNVRVQAMLKVKLEKVRDIVGDVVGLLDNHPDILTNLTGGLGKGLEGALSGKNKNGGVDNLSEEDVDKMDDKDKDKMQQMLKDSKKNQKEDEESDEEEED